MLTSAAVLWAPGNAAVANELRVEPSRSSDGVYQLSWSFPGAIRLEEAETPDFSDALLVYEGDDKAATLSGRPDGTYYYRATAVPPDATGAGKAAGSTVEKGVPSDDVGAMIRRAILENEFWVLPNAEVYYPVFDAELAEIKAGISS